MRIELRDQGAVDLEPVIVLGYPVIAGHEPALIPVNAQATGGVPTYGGTRRCLVLQRMTTPGFSAGPVLDRRGMVVGVIREEGGSDRGGSQGVFIFGTPAHYLHEVLAELANRLKVLGCNDIARECRTMPSKSVFEIVS